MRSWRRSAYRLVRPLLFAADPERVHHLTLSALGGAAASPPGRWLCAVAAGAPRTEPIELMGLRFRNRVGLAAGFDKDGDAIRGWAALGLGFAELGTVTPRAQPGNERPRLWRLPADGALINRMGFNNAGAEALARRLAAARRRLPPGFVVGVNIGRNRDTPPAGAVDDYAAAAEQVGHVADYLAVNISSPNTPGLRQLEDPERIGPLVAAVSAAAPGRPILVKLSPDLHARDFDARIDAIGASGAAGVILSNTSATRAGLRRASTVPSRGGVSGRPLLVRTLRAVARARDRAGGRLTIVASGGIGSGGDARQALEEGADLVQLWTGLVYAGTGLIGECVHGTARRGDDGRGR